MQCLINFLDNLLVIFKIVVLEKIFKLRFKTKLSFWTL